MTDADWADLFDEDDKPAAKAETEPEPAAGAAAPSPVRKAPPGFEKPLAAAADAPAVPATVREPEQQKQSFGGGDAALAALMGGAQPTTLAVRARS